MRGLTSMPSGSSDDGATRNEVNLPKFSLMLVLLELLLTLGVVNFAIHQIGNMDEIGGVTKCVMQWFCVILFLILRSKGIVLWLILIYQRIEFRDPSKVRRLPN